jgi:hypothetical protein
MHGGGELTLTNEFFTPIWEEFKNILRGQMRAYHARMSSVNPWICSGHARMTTAHVRVSMGNSLPPGRKPVIIAGNLRNTPQRMHINSGGLTVCS